MQVVRVGGLGRRGRLRLSGRRSCFRLLTGSSCGPVVSRLRRGLSSVGRRCLSGPGPVSGVDSLLGLRDGFGCFCGLCGFGRRQLFVRVRCLGRRIRGDRCSVGQRVDLVPRVGRRQDVIGSRLRRRGRCRTVRLGRRGVVRSLLGRCCVLGRRCFGRCLDGCACRLCCRACLGGLVPGIDVVGGCGCGRCFGLGLGCCRSCGLGGLGLGSRGCAGGFVPRVDVVGGCGCGRCLDRC